MAPLYHVDLQHFACIGNEYRFVTYVLYQSIGNFRGLSGKRIDLSNSKEIRSRAMTLTLTYRDCQKAHWKAHKKDCARLAQDEGLGGEEQTQA